MKVSGFTVIRNGTLMGYPFLQSIQSLLPLVDEMIIGVGQSDAGDTTKELILALNNPKIKIFDSFWDTSRTKGGFILSEKTNEALDRCHHDWCFYIQADEVVHEDDLPAIKQALEANEKNPKIQGLLFKYVHFYGSYQTIATSRKWYRNEIRVIKRSSGARSFNDAQGFRINGEKLTVAPSGGRIFHYGWVKPPKMMGQKSKLLSRWWHGDKLDNAFDDFQYDRQYGLRSFEGTHPRVMHDLVANQDWSFDPRRSLSDWTLKDVNLLASDVFEKTFKFRIGEYRPYRLVK